MTTVVGFIFFFYIFFLGVTSPIYVSFVCFFCFFFAKMREEQEDVQEKGKCTRCERTSQADRLLTSSICLCLANFAFFWCHSPPQLSPSLSLSLSFFSSSEAISIWCFLQWKSGNLSETSLGLWFGMLEWPAPLLDVSLHCGGVHILWSSSVSIR